MAAETFDSDKDGTKPTQGVGNAGGRPIRPILFGVGAVIALILVTLMFSRRPGNVNVGTSESGPIPEPYYSPASTSDTALGQRAAAGTADTASRPAVAPMSSPGFEGTSVSGSSSLPVPGVAYSPNPMASPTPATPSAGQNFVAPPGPSVNRQGMNQ